jgi:hypothetical protein
VDAGGGGGGAGSGDALGDGDGEGEGEGDGSWAAALRTNESGMRTHESTTRARDGDRRRIKTSRDGREGEPCPPMATGAKRGVFF